MFLPTCGRILPTKLPTSAVTARNEWNAQVTPLCEARIKHGGALGDALELTRAN